MKEEIRNIELSMLAQFIKEMDNISKYNSIEEVKKEITKRKKEYLKIIKSKGGETEFFSINLDADFINQKLQKGKKIYPENKPINEVHLAYKIGLIDGMKIKSE